MFYKYLHYSDEASFSKLIEGTLINPTLMFVAPETLNDPNEFKFNLEIELNDVEKLRERFIKDTDNTKEDDFQHYLETLKSHNYIFSKKQEIRADLMMVINLISLSKTHKSNLLWCHYTDVGNGFCIIYKNEIINYLQDNQLIDSYGDVTYKPQPPTISFPSDDLLTIMQKIVYTKETCWSYEKEFRMTVPNKVDERTFIKIPHSLIFGIIIGARMEIQKVQTIIQISKQKGYKYFYASELGSGYQPLITKGVDGTVPIRKYIN